MRKALNFLWAHRFPVALTLLLVLFVTLVWTAAARKSETMDEGLFIAGGAAQVQHRNPNIDLSHPPLLRWVAGTSASTLGRAELPPKPPMVTRTPKSLRTDKLQSTFNWAQRLLYHPKNDHDRVLFWGRFPFAFFGVLAGLLLGLELRKRYGDLPALAAVAVFAFLPEVLAHAQWAHSDLAAACGTLALALMLAHALEHPGRRVDLLLGLVLGLLVMVKLTGLMFVPLVVLLMALFPGTPKGRGRLWWTTTRLACVLGVLYVVIVVSYLPDPRLLPPHRFVAAEQSGFLATLLTWLPLPDTFIRGVVYTRHLADHGQIAYLHGETRTGGWWYYFPLAMILKYPTPLLLAAVAGLVAVIRSRRVALSRKLAWTLFPLLLLGAAMFQRINIGVRSMLPLAPFIVLWAVVGLAEYRHRIFQVALPLALLLSIAAGLGSYPYFLGYFNPLFGGPAAADRWLVDSNNDWGQDLPALARTIKRRRIQHLRLHYFGAAIPSHYGIRGHNPLVRRPGWYAISRTYLSGMWPRNDPHAWLRKLKPVELVGSSIVLFRVRPRDVPEGEPAPGRQRPRPRLAPGRKGQTMAQRNVQRMALGLYLLNKRRNYRPAIGAFLTVLAANPRHYGAMFQLAKGLEAHKRGDLALAVWTQVLALAKGAKDHRSMKYAQSRIEELSKKHSAVDPNMKLGLKLHYQDRKYLDACVAYALVLLSSPLHVGARFQLAKAAELARFPTVASAARRRLLEIRKARRRKPVFGGSWGKMQRPMTPPMSRPMTPPPRKK